MRKAGHVATPVERVFFMALKSTVCSVLKLFRIHPFDCERCASIDECEGRYMRDRLQELCRESKLAEARAEPSKHDAA